MKYINADESAHRKLQRVLKDDLKDCTDEYSEDDQASYTNKFQLPKRLRGRLFMERASISVKDHSGIINMTG